MNDFFAKSDELSAITFWNNFSKELENQNQTIRTCCFMAGLNESSIRSSKSRHLMPMLSTAYALAKELNVSLEYLITGVEPSEKIPDDLQQVINKYAQSI